MLCAKKQRDAFLDSKRQVIVGFRYSCASPCKVLSRCKQKVGTLHVAQSVCLSESMSGSKAGLNMIIKMRHTLQEL